jgi:hypothetical protein
VKVTVWIIMTLWLDSTGRSIMDYLIDWLQTVIPKKPPIVKDITVLEHSQWMAIHQ